MAEEPDGIDEVMQSGLRVVVSAAGQGVEHLARSRAAAARDARHAREQRARVDAARLEAERAVARSQLASVARSGWWEHATPQDIASAWDTATAWQAHDAQAQRAVAVMREQLQERYDLDDVPVDPVVLRDELARRVGEQNAGAPARPTSPLQAAQAAVLLTGPVEATAADSDQVDVAADAQPVAYDSPERRAALAVSLEGHVEPEAIAARVLADVSEALPAVEAVARGPRAAPRARRSRQSGERQLAPARRSERGR